MKIIYSLILFVFCFSGSGVNAKEHNTADVFEAPFDIDLWENEHGHSVETKISSYDDGKRNFKPSIRVYLPKASKPTKAVVICPGGGYKILAMRNEGYNWGAYFKELGIAAIVLKYRKPNGRPDMPVSDAKEAIRLIKRYANEWNINPDSVGIMGFSAGGHLASTLAVHAPQELKPAFQILFYPVITMEPSNAHKGSRERFIGKKPTEELEKLYSNELQVNTDTPSAFIALSEDDKVVKPVNALNYHSALLDNGVPSTIHIYPTGGHGWGIKRNFKYHNEMLSELKSWLLNN